MFINQLTLVIAAKSARGLAAIHAEDIAIPLLGGFNVRWYHLFLTAAFLVANIWNFQLNRAWTFRRAHHRGWLREYSLFLATGLASLAVGLAISTALLHPNSSLRLSPGIFDKSSGLRNPLYWANLIQIALTMPINFAVNRLWTFKSTLASAEES